MKVYLLTVKELIPSDCECTYCPGGEREGLLIDSINILQEVYAIKETACRAGAWAKGKRHDVVFEVVEKELDVGF